MPKKNKSQPQSSRGLYLKNVQMRKAQLRDLTRLVELENSTFDYDQLSRRNFQWMIKKGHSLFLVQEYKSEIIGYGLVLMNSGTSLARLYSICTRKDFQGKGLGTQMLTELEKRLVEDDNCAYLRLEVKANNPKAIKLYKKLGYVKFTEKEDYYDDGSTAFCFEKQIRNLDKKTRQDIPYYSQKTEFTCGPSCLLMAMKAFNPKVELSLSNELQVWREATTIFMTAGHGGCGPHGLALSAWRRGYKAEMYLSHLNSLFTETVRNPDKKKIISLVQKDFEKKISQTNIKVHNKPLGLGDLKDIFKKGGIAMVLISTSHFDTYRTPHWVLVTAYDDSFVYFHDPYEGEEHQSVSGRVHIPIQEQQFLKVTRFGKHKIAAAVVVYSD